jgi:hypothetical protein
VIETVAAEDLPLVALDAGGQPGARLQAEIEVDEVKRTSDPRDAGNNMQPAQNGAHGFGENKLHDVGLPPRAMPEKTTMTEPAQPAQVCRRGAVLSRFPHLPAFARADFIG